MSRLINSLRSIKRLVFIMLYAAGQLVNVLAVLLIIFFVYAVLGVSLFGMVKHGEFINNR